MSLKLTTSCNRTPPALPIARPARRFATLVLIPVGLCFAIRTGQGQTPSTVMTPFGVVLGQSSLVDVLRKLGPAAGVGLWGHGQEWGPTVGDRVISIRYSALALQLDRKYVGEATMNFESDRSTLSVVAVAFTPNERPSGDALVARFGQPAQKAHLAWKELSGGDDLVLGDCDDPNGMEEVWVFPQAAMRAFMDRGMQGKRLARQLAFSIELARGGLTYPPCPGKPGDKK